MLPQLNTKGFSQMTHSKSNAQIYENSVLSPKKKKVDREK